MILPWCLPPTTFNFACNIELELRPTNWPTAESFGRVQVRVLVAATRAAPDAGTLTSRRSSRATRSAPGITAVRTATMHYLRLFSLCANNHVCDNERPVCIGY